MNQLLMPQHMLGCSRQATMYHQPRIQHRVRLFARGLWRTTVTNKYKIAVIMLFAILFSPPLSGFAQSPIAEATAAPAQTVITRSDAEVYYLTAVNKLRASRGLAPLIIDSRLTASAMHKGTDMVAQNYWAHYAPNGTSYADYIWQNSPAAYRVGENLARCFDSRQAAFDALVASPTHYAIMTGQFTNFGVAEVEDTQSGCTYTTMHFAEYQK